MQLYDIVTKDSIFHEIGRECKASIANYPLRDRAARVNDAIYRYCTIAFKSDGKHSFDDINQSSPPIDTQSIVSGTNRYKFSAFTEKIMNLIKLEALDADGNGIELKFESFDSLASSPKASIGNSSRTFQELYIDASSGTPSKYTKYGDFIYLRDNPNYSETNGLVAYFNRPASTFDYLRFTVTQANPGVFTTASVHGMAVNDLVVFDSNGTIPTGITANTIYYIKTAPSTTTFTIASTLGGTAIEITDDQDDSVHMCLHASIIPGIPLLHHSYLARHASLPYLRENDKKQYEKTKRVIGSDNPRSAYYGGDELEIAEFFANRDKDVRDVLSSRITPFR